MHAFFARRAHTQCLDYARNNVWNAVILEGVPENKQFLNLELQVSQEWNGVMINCDATGKFAGHLIWQNDCVCEI